ncbi:MAG: dephospho-CoA kinase [Chloroflexi bacterium]|nr:dephospho-CoA kinase [Chloroflexota bacterium]
MVVIGLTGNIATGKSTVLAMLRELGAASIDADAVVHQLMEPDSPVTREIREAFGSGVIGPSGGVDRRALGRIVFADPAALQRLEEIVHPAVVAEIDRWLAAVKRPADGASPPAAVVDAVKLVESSLAMRCDSIWVVVAAPAQQRERLVSQRGLSLEDADARLAAQPSLTSRLEHANVVIDNSGTVEETRAQVRRAWQQLVG